MASCWLLRWQRLRLMLRPSHPSAATTVDTVENLSKFSNLKEQQIAMDKFEMSSLFISVH